MDFVTIITAILSWYNVSKQRLIVNKEKISISTI